jgi:hypothetical protein
VEGCLEINPASNRDASRNELIVSVKSLVAVLFLSLIKLPNQSRLNLRRAPFAFSNSADVSTINTKASGNPAIDSA